MKNALNFALILLLSLFSVMGSGQSNPRLQEGDYSFYVNPHIGTGGNGNAIPIASVPHGMIQVAPDTRNGGSGYQYEDNSIIGFSHIHKTGGGCGDLLDILFQPISDSTSINPGPARNPDAGYRSRFSHEDEFPEAGKYSVLLADYNIQVELTASERTAMHRYTFLDSDFKGLIIDLKHGNTGTCTIVPEEAHDTVRIAYIKVLDNRTIEGYRISDGWSKGQHVYFTATFSQAFQKVYLFDHSQPVDGTSLTSTDVRVMLKFDTATQDPLLVKVGISAVDNDGSSLNAESEIPHWDFEEVASEARNKWNQTLGRFIVDEGNADDLVKFYTGIFHWSAYPMIYSDVDGRYRGPNEEIQLADNFIYYGAVMGLWDTFRAANPLLVNTKPEIANDYILTFLAIYQQSGLLPVWVLQSHETLTMIGYHSMPVIADTYFKGVRDYDVESVYDAMVNSACKDSFGISMGRMMGTKNYKKFAYIPADLEYESVAQTLEFAYDDWCIAQMARMLGKDKDYKYFIKRAGNYQHVFDLNTGFMRGRMADGSWREPFDPFSSHHRRDDYCEGTAWQWTFFVPHDIDGLAKLLGGRIQLAGKLDSLFSTSSQITSTKGESSGDISGLIGQYAHGNEPSHHIPYMYNDVGQPWKAQKLVHEIMNNLYKNSPLGYSGNEDTGQMAAWFIWNAMGMYPVTHGDGRYSIGSPLFKKISFRHGNGTLSIMTDKTSPDQIYISRIWVNGKKYKKLYFDHEDIFKADATIEFQMSKHPEDSNPGR